MLKRSSPSALTLKRPQGMAVPNSGFRGPAVVSRDIRAPKINAFCRQEVVLSNEVKTKV